MRILNIEIKNFRQYQSLSFTFPESASNDLHIIIAQNGVGKTNLLNSITWCLYGTEPHLGDDARERGLPKLNLSAIDEAMNDGRDTEVVQVEIRAQDGDEYITYKRSLPFRIKPRVFEEIAREKFTVTIATSAGDTKVYEDGDTTKHLVEKYMPEKIREYFYFDGEQLNNYFISTRKGKVRDAIFSISQVDIVNRIDKHIDELIKDKQKEAAAKAPDIKKITDELNEVEVQTLSVEHKIANYEDQISKSEHVIRENTEYLQGEENQPELEKRFQDLRVTQTGLIGEKKELIGSMSTFVRQMKTTLTFYTAAKKTLDIISKKEEAKALPLNMDITLLQKAINEHICTICNQSLSQHEEGLIRRLIDSFQISSTASHTLIGIRSELERIINEAEAYPFEKRKFIKKYKLIDKQLNQVENELGDVDKRINRISDLEEVKHKHKEREEHEDLRKLNIEKLGVAKDQFNKSNTSYEELEKQLEKALAKDAECSRIRHLIDFATKGRDIIRSVEKEMMDEVRKKMETRTTHYFMNLIWKQNTYDRIVLDEEFYLDLIHKSGYSCVGTCSAAERCLLALSFTLALHEVSGFNSLLFIDTPVARVSDINRVNFADVLCEVSKNKQIIMTFTPDEYSPEIKRIFDVVARTNVELQMVDEKITVVR